MVDTKQDIKCPACGTLMKKICIGGKFYVDICSQGCGGIWFDNQELEKLSSEHLDLALILQDFITMDHISVVDSVRKCPVCHFKMVKNKVYAGVPVIIDECYSCGGKFLDKGELKTLLNDKQKDVNEFVRYLLNNKK